MKFKFRWFLFSLFAFLCGCVPSYQSDQKFDLYPEFVIVDQTFDLATSDIESLSFEPFDYAQKINFTEANQLLLKVEILPNPAFESISELTLSIYPKYLDKVIKINGENTSEFESQYRIQTDSPRLYSSQRFAFNIDSSSIEEPHYLLLDARNPRYVYLNLYDTKEYSHLDFQANDFFTFIYTLIFAMAIFNAVFYFYNRETHYLLYTIYMLTSLVALLWQEGKINNMPYLAWHVMGENSSLVFFYLTTLTGTIFFYNFLKMKWQESWLIKVLIAVIAFQTCLLLITLIKYHLLEGFEYANTSKIFNLSVLASSFLTLVIIIIKTIQKQPQSMYLLVAWGIMIASVFLRIYFSFNPHPDLLWMSHSYEYAVMLEGLILAFAIGNRSMDFKKQRDQAVNKYSKAERSIHKHQLLHQFQAEMQTLAKDSTLSAIDMAEKTNIKFHLLLTRAFPIKNSLILEGEDLKGVCTTGIDSMDIDFLKQQAVEILKEENPGVIQKLVNLSGDKQSSVLFIPLRKQYSNKVIFILGLKNNDEISSAKLSDLQKYCGQAYNELLKAKEIYQVALAANMDGLTGCYNRASIENIITQSLNQKVVTTVAFVDLDHLKAINDNHGHHIGDQCIVDFAHLLENHLLQDGKVGRVGGDEFLVVFSGIEFDRCIEDLESFMVALSSMKASKHDIKLTCSIGIAESRMNETTKSIIKKADKALYCSKEEGRNQLTNYDDILNLGIDSKDDDQSIETDKTKH